MFIAFVKTTYVKPDYEIELIYAIGLGICGLKLIKGWEFWFSGLKKLLCTVNSAFYSSFESIEFVLELVLLLISEPDLKLTVNELEAEG